MRRGVLIDPLHLPGVWEGLVPASTNLEGKLASRPTHPRAFEIAPRVPAVMVWRRLSSLRSGGTGWKACPTPWIYRGKLGEYNTAFKNTGSVPLQKRRKIGSSANVMTWPRPNGSLTT